MKRYTILYLFMLVANALFAQGQWQQIWADEFDYTGLPNADKWSYDIGCATNNNEKQYYAKERLENTRVENGNLVIEARKESLNGCGYTSGRIKTQFKGDWLYGKFEIRAKIPAFKGTWPAIWFLPSDSEYGGWPKSGEMDLMESVGYDPDKTFFTVHTEAYNHTINTQKGANTSTTNLSADFHTYTLEWYADSVCMFLDGTRYFTFKKEAGTYKQWPFDKPFHLLLNLAIGGDWGGLQGIDDTQFPTQYLIDYVRVYQWQTSGGPYTLNFNNYSNGSVQTSPTQNNYTLNQQVSLAATANQGYDFAGWQSDFYSSKNPLVLNMNRNITVRPLFKKQGEMVVNGNFESKIQNWNFSSGGASVGTSALSNEALNITVSTANSAAPWDIQLQQYGFNLVNGHTYKLSFDAKATNTMSVTAGVGLNASPWNSYGSITANVGTTQQTYTKTFTMNTNDPMARFYFDLAKNSGTLTFDNISLVDLTVPTGVEELKIDFSNTVFYYQRDKKLLSFKSDQNIDSIAIFSMTGQLLKEINSVSGHDFEFQTSEKVVFIKYTKADGNTYAKKISLE